MIYQILKVAYYTSLEKKDLVNFCSLEKVVLTCWEYSLNMKKRYSEDILTKTVLTIFKDY